MLPIQLFLLAFFVLAIIKVVFRFRAGDISMKEVFSWVFFWLIAGAVAIDPNLTARFAKILGVGRGADAVVYMSLAALFFIVFRLMVKIEKLNREITKIVRDEALKK